MINVLVGGVILACVAVAFAAAVAGYGAWVEARDHTAALKRFREVESRFRDVEAQVASLAKELDSRAAAITSLTVDLKDQIRPQPRKKAGQRAPQRSRAPKPVKPQVVTRKAS